MTDNHTKALEKLKADYGAGVVRRSVMTNVIRFMATGLLFLAGLPLFADYDDTTELERLAARYLEAIIPLFSHGETNPAHAETNTRIDRAFKRLLWDFPHLTRKQLDSRAAVLLDMLYRDVHLGSLEDSPDIRRQTHRAVTIFLGLAVCSENDYTYWLDLAEDHLPAKDEDYYHLLIGYYLMKAYIYYVRGDPGEAAWTLDTLFQLPEWEDFSRGEAAAAAREFRRMLPEL